ncbi:MAG: esterase/lipase family protein, partial [Promethearchaeota archaeon]
MRDFDYRVIDIYEEDNLIDGVLQHLPAYLTISFNVQAKYTFIAESPKGEITGHITGWARPGFINHWRLPILAPGGEWKVEIHLHYDDPIGMLLETILITVPSELFSHPSEKSPSIEDDYFAEINVPTEEEIQYVDVTSRLTELDAHWLQLDSDLKIWRYVHHDTESRLKEDRFFPILLVHGFTSSYTTWNWIVRYLWTDMGFRNIFGMALYDDKLGVEKNADHLEKVIDEVLNLTNHDSLYLISHSLGGLIGRYFVKMYDPRKIRLLVTLGSPHMCGVPRFWGKIFALFKKAQLTGDELTLHPSSKTRLTQTIFTEADLYILTMVNICGTKLRGGDGGFKAADNNVPDMVNLTVNYSHLSLHKNKEFFMIMRKLLLGESIIYKIRLLYVTTTRELAPKCRLYLRFKPRGKDNYQRYPYREYIQLNNERYVPEIPVIVFTYLRNEKKAKIEHLEIQILSEEDEVVTQKNIIFGLGYKDKVSDLFN